MIKFLLYSNVLISAGAALFTLFFHRVFKIDPDYPIIAMVGILTFVAYNFQRIIKVKIAEANNEIKGIERLEWIQKNMNLIIRMTGIAAVAGLFLFRLDFKIILVLSLAGVFSFFYVVKMPGIKMRLREIPGAKIILISLSYAMCCVLLPATQAELSGSLVISSFTSAFFFILAITIPFDIRDINFDSKKIKTIPQLFGQKGAKTIAICALIISFTLLFWITRLPIALLISIVPAIILILKSNPKRHFYFYAIAIDGLLILLPLLFELEITFF